jgi:hypothetical protein
VEAFKITCPYCGEIIDILIDVSVAEQEYYEDCSVCCCPILFDIKLDDSDNVKVSVKTDNE